jgi:Protein of unknown function (DUF3592)
MNRESSPSWILIALWPIAFVIVWAIWNLIRDRQDEKEVEKSLDWPETQGTVATTEVAWAHVEVSYKYSVAGTEYTGKYEISLSPVAPDRSGSGAAQLNAEAQREMTDYPPGTNLIIRYNPKKPEESVLFCKGGGNRKETDKGESTPHFSTLS